MHAGRTLAKTLFTLALLLLLAPALGGNARAEAWDGSVATGYAGGLGTTADNPYLIATGAQLAYLAQQVNGNEDYAVGKYFKLTDDIDLNNKPWTRIGIGTGGNGRTFGGTFDGNGKLIQGLKVEVTSSAAQDYVGLFGYVNKGVVKNLSVQGTVQVTCNCGYNCYIGGIVGLNYEGRVENCSALADVSVTVNNGNAYIGGVVGASNNYVQNCSSRGNVTVTVTSGAAFVGGVVGQNYKTGNPLSPGKVSHCLALGSVAATGNAQVGGIVGKNAGGSISNCYYNTDAPNTQISDSPGVTGLTAAEFRDQSKFEGFNFTDTWVMGPNRPVLRALGVTVDTWDALHDALAIATEDKPIILGGDVTYGTGGGANANSALEVPSGKTAVLDLNGHVVDRANTSGSAGAVITVQSSLALNDSRPNEAHPYYVDEDGLWHVFTNTTAAENNPSYLAAAAGNRGTLTGGVLTGCGNIGGSGGGVYVAANGTFTMHGGAVCGNAATVSGGGTAKGGGVYVAANGTFTMSGGAICGNVAHASGENQNIPKSYGGGVFLESSKLTMSGDARVSDNKASILSNGSTIGNQGLPIAHGGGVYVASGELMMSGSAEISGNTARTGGNNDTTYYSRGGGVFLESGKLTMSDSAKISGNTASNNISEHHAVNALGGGVYVAGSSVYAGELTMSGSAEISGNTAAGKSTSEGGGVYMGDKTTFTMYGGSISGNTATAEDNTGSSSRGGGAYLGSAFTISGGTISGNAATASSASGSAYAYGGGVYSFSGQNTPTMSGGSISGNTATASSASGSANACGGGACISASSNFLMTGSAEVSGNTVTANSTGGAASAHGGGVFVDSNSGDNPAKFYVSGSVTVTGGTGSVYLDEETAVIVRDALTGAAHIGVTAADAQPGTVVARAANNYGTLTTTDAACFQSDSAAYLLVLSDTGATAGKLILQNVPAPPAPPAPSGGSGHVPELFRQKFDSPLVFGGGKVYVSPTEVGIDDTVTLTAAPDAGYRLAALRVDRIGGEPVALTDKGNGVYTFQMPGWRIAVNAQFEPIPAEQSAPQPSPETAQTEPEPLPPGNLPGVVLSPQTVTVNGAAAKVEAYNIGGTNFFMLRDLAALLRDTGACFNIAFDAARDTVVVFTGEAYAGEVNASFTDRSRRAVNSYQRVEIDGREVALTAYNIGGNNFFGLRELAAYLGYAVDYDAASNTAIIESK